MTGRAACLHAVGDRTSMASEGTSQAGRATREQSASSGTEERTAYKCAASSAHRLQYDEARPADVRTFLRPDAARILTRVGADLTCLNGRSRDFRKPTVSDAGPISGQFRRHVTQIVRHAISLFQPYHYDSFGRSA